LWSGISGRRRFRDFATATRRPTSHLPARSPASGLARLTFPNRSRRIVVRNVVDRLLQHKHDAWAPPCDCVDTSRVFLEFPRTRCFGAVSGMPEAASSARSSCLRRTATGRGSPSRGCFPIGNARAPTRRVSNTPSSPSRAYVALEKPVAFRVGRGPSADVVPRRTRALRSSAGRADVSNVRGPRCFGSC
jgi:hypothetical protein